MEKELYIIGAGGLGREILATLKHCDYLTNYNSVYFIDKEPRSVNDIQVIGNNEYLKKIKYKVDVIIALSNCKIREKIIQELSVFPHINFITFIHPKSSIYDNKTIEIGKGCYIGENCILTTNVIIKDFCFLNINVSLHHDTILNENCFLMPGVRITGGAEIKENTYIGSNYTIMDNRIIEKNSILTLAI
jgi:sugar O-acyltransferase (sialic acid O-acetyltransferase NeuD family)